METFPTHVVLIQGRRLPRRHAGEDLFDGDDGDEEKPWGHEYRHRGSDRLVILREIVSGGGQILVSVWVKAATFARARRIAADFVLAPLMAAGRLLASVDVVRRASGREAVPDAATEPLIAAIWPPSWRVRRPADGPEWIGGPLPLPQSPGLPPSGEPFLLESVA